MKKKGFTLIELLVTITILAVVSAIGLASFGKAQMVGRDGKRKTDLRQVATALELYKQKNGRYPCPPVAPDGFWNLSSDTPGTLWINDSNFASCSTDTAAKKLDTNYINQMPKDPSSNSGLNPVAFLSGINNKGYAYGFANVSGGSCPSTLAGNYYVLVTTLENSSDKDADSKQHETYKYCDGTTYIFGTNNNANGFAVISP